VIFDRAFVSIFVSIWIFEGDPEVYILALACESSQGERLITASL
jgi:hypothetical protein